MFADVLTANSNHTFTRHPKHQMHLAHVINNNSSPDITQLTVSGAHVINNNSSPDVTQLTVSGLK